MKLILMLFALPILGQVTPSCSYTLLHPPAGTTLVFRNGTLVRESVDYAWTGPRTFGVANFADGDKITAYYTFQRPNKAFLPTAEYTACVGNQNPPPTVQVSRAQCIGAGTTPQSLVPYNCAGLELWTVVSGGVTRSYAALPATQAMLNLPACPVTGGLACLRPAGLGDPPLLTNFLLPGTMVPHFLPLAVFATTTVPLSFALTELVK